MQLNVVKITFLSKTFRKTSRFGQIKGKLATLLSFSQPYAHALNLRAQNSQHGQKSRAAGCLPYSRIILKMAKRGFFS